MKRSKHHPELLITSPSVCVCPGVNMRGVFRFLKGKYGQKVKKEAETSDRLCLL